MKPDDEVCLCYGVSLRKLVNYIQREQPPVASLVSRCLSAGTGCGWCVPFLEKLHRDVMAGRLDALDEVDFSEYEALRAAWMEQKQPNPDVERFAEEALAITSSTKESRSPSANVTENS